MFTSHKLAVLSLALPYLESRYLLTPNLAIRHVVVYRIWPNLTCYLLALLLRAGFTNKLNAFISVRTRSYPSPTCD